MALASAKIHAPVAPDAPKPRLNSQGVRAVPRSTTANMAKVGEGRGLYRACACAGSICARRAFADPVVDPAFARATRLLTRRTSDLSRIKFGAKCRGRSSRHLRSFRHLGRANALDPNPPGVSPRREGARTIPRGRKGAHTPARSASMRRASRRGRLARVLAASALARLGAAYETVVRDGALVLQPTADGSTWTAAVATPALASPLGANADAVPGALALAPGGALRVTRATRAIPPTPTPTSRRSSSWARARLARVGNPRTSPSTFASPPHTPRTPPPPRVDLVRPHPRPSRRVARVHRARRSRGLVPRRGGSSCRVHRRPPRGLRRRRHIHHQLRRRFIFRVGSHPRARGSIAVARLRRGERVDRFARRRRRARVDGDESRPRRQSCRRRPRHRPRVRSGRARVGVGVARREMCRRIIRRRALGVRRRGRRGRRKGDGRRGRWKGPDAGPRTLVSLRSRARGCVGARVLRGGGVVRECGVRLRVEGGSHGDASRRGDARRREGRLRRAVPRETVRRGGKEEEGVDRADDEESGCVAESATLAAVRAFVARDAAANAPNAAVASYANDTARAILSSSPPRPRPRRNRTTRHNRTTRSSRTTRTALS